MPKHTTLIDLGRKHPLFGYADEVTGNSKNLYNRTLFLQRNIMTGLKKPPRERHPLEQEAIDTVLAGLRAHNKKAEGSATKKAYDEPTAETWLLSAYALSTILQETGDTDYYSMPGQVNQRTVSKAVEAMKSFLSLLRKWNQDPSSLNGKPALPHYRKNGHMTASFSAQVCSVEKEEDGKQYLKFPKTKAALCLGHMDLKGKLQSVEIVPYGNGYRVCITTDDGLPEEEPVPKEKRCYAVDPGVDNFATVTGNFEMQPFVLDGKFLKSWNRLYNKKRAAMRSKQTAGTATEKGKHIPETRAMKQATMKRERRIRDAFYKMAHFLCRKAEADRVDTIIFGWNREVKTGIRIGDANDQNFVQIPFRRFAAILKTVAVRYGIAVVDQEESYTSKSSFLDGDPIPVYGEKGASGTEFSGKRIRRSVYRSKNGTVLHADVNGSLNILRKRKPDAFDHMKDGTCFLRPVKRYRFDTFYRKKKPDKGIAPTVYSGSSVLPGPA